MRRRGGDECCGGFKWNTEVGVVSADFPVWLGPIPECIPVTECLESDMIVASFACPFLPVNMVCAIGGRGRGVRIPDSAKAAEKMTGWDGCAVEGC